MDILHREKLPSGVVLLIARSKSAYSYYKLGLLECAPNAPTPSSIRDRKGITVLKVWNGAGRSKEMTAPRAVKAWREATKLVDFFRDQGVDSTFWYVKTGFIKNFGDYKAPSCLGEPR